MLAMPLLVAGLLALVAWRLQVRGRARAARRLLVLAALLAWLGSTRLVGDTLLAPLEHRYVTLTGVQPLPQVGYVVVLGADYSPRAGAGVAAALGADSIMRIVEGVRLVRQLGAARLVVSGGAPPREGAPALGYAEFAREWGVPEASIIALREPLDTRSEAKAAAALLGASPFILVTAASHMPRAVWLMRRSGTRPIPDPIGQQARSIPDNFPGGLLPGSRGLSATEHALHEYMGLVAITFGVD